MEFTEETAIAASECCLSDSDNKCALCPFAESYRDCEGLFAKCISNILLTDTKESQLPIPIDCMELMRHIGEPIFIIPKDASKDVYWAILDGLFIGGHKPFTDKYEYSIITSGEEDSIEGDNYYIFDMNSVCNFSVEELIKYYTNKTTSEKEN